MALTGILSAILAFVYGVTEPKRLEILREEKMRALEEVLPGAEHFEEEDWYFKGYEQSGQEEPVGYAFPVRGTGYSATIETMVGVSRQSKTGALKISGIKIISQQETPGLGSRVEEIPASRTLPDIIMGRKKEAPEEEPEPWFQAQFRNKTPDELEINNIEGITGATITTEAVIDSITRGIKELREEILAK